MVRLDIVLATQNAHKTKEFQALVPNGIRLLSLRDIGWFGSMPEESGATYEENAKIKALYIATELDLPTLADDSGFEVVGLMNRPGVHSARYGQTNDEKIQRSLLLKEAEHLVDRRARFVCVLAFGSGRSDPVDLYRGEIEGELLREEHGSGGFGYDSLFRPAGESLSFAEMNMDQKNRMSHRTRAIALLLRRWG